MLAKSVLLVFCLLQWLSPNSSFTHSGVKIARQSSKQIQRNSLTMNAAQAKRALLDKSTLWRISLTLTKSGFKSIETIARVRFIEDRDYEPPQGRIFIEDDFNGLIKVDERGYAGTWTLSEDKDDRKDGLWIWGLFQEPKYPFLYFSLGIFKSILLPSGQEEPIFGGEGVPNDRLNIRMSHIRDEVKGAVLSAGTVDYQLTEMVKADPFGVGGMINAGDKIVAGTIDIRPVFGSANDKEDEELMAKILQGISAEAAAVPAASA